MTAKSFIPAIPASGTRRWLWLLLLGFGGFVVVLVVVYVLRKKAMPPITKLPGTNADGTPPANNGTGIPPVTGAGNGNTPASTVVNQDYIEMLAWKLKATLDEGQDHGCEVTNGIVEMGETDLTAFMQLYENWYGKNLTAEYCNRMKDSACWTSLWDGKKDKACQRLSLLNSIV